MRIKTFFFVFSWFMGTTRPEVLEVCAINKISTDNSSVFFADYKMHNTLIRWTFFPNTLQYTQQLFNVFHGIKILKLIKPNQAKIFQYPR